MHLIDVYKSFDLEGFRILAGSKLKICNLSYSLSSNVIAQSYERLCFNGSLPLFGLDFFVDLETLQTTSANLTDTDYRGGVLYYMYDSVTQKPVVDMAEYISGVYNTDEIPEYSI